MTELETLRDVLAEKTRALAMVREERDEAIHRLNSRDEECDRLEINEIASANRHAALCARLAEQGAKALELSREADSRIENLNGRIEQGRRAYQVALSALAERDAECDRLRDAAKESQSSLHLSIADMLVKTKHLLSVHHELVAGGHMHTDVLQEESCARDAIIALLKERDILRARLSACEPAIEALREMQDDARKGCYSAVKNLALMNMQLPEKATQ